jgi:hypothetical protein
METQRGQTKGFHSWLVRWACRAGPIDICSALSALVGPVQNIFFLVLNTLFQFLFPHRLASWQAAVLGRLSLGVCL